MVLAQTKNYYGIPHSKEAWAKYLLHVVRWLQQKGYSHVIIETDCKLVVDDIASSQEPNNDFSTLFYSAKTLYLPYLTLGRFLLGGGKSTVLLIV